MNWKKAMITTFVGLVVPMGLGIAETAASNTGDNTTRYGGQRLIQALGLTSDQATQFQQMFQQHVAAMKAEKERFEAQVNGILTPDQQARFKDLMQKRGERMKQVQGFTHPGGGRFGGGLKQLNLSADQKAQVKTIMQDMKTKLAAVAPGDNVTRKQIRQDMHAQLAKVLTPDQLNQLKRARQAHRENKVCNIQQGQ
jgi:Spy/CpxP family protein refolding chaperone